MIITENIVINGTEFVRTYSDKGYYVEREGVQYSEAIDPFDSGREYIETDVVVENDIDEDIPAEELKAMIEEAL